MGSPPAGSSPSPDPTPPRSPVGSPRTHPSGRPRHRLSGGTPARPRPGPGRTGQAAESGRSALTRIGAPGNHVRGSAETGSDAGRAAAAHQQVDLPSLHRCGEAVVDQVDGDPRRGLARPRPVDLDPFQAEAVAEARIDLGEGAGAPRVEDTAVEVGVQVGPVEALELGGGRRPLGPGRRRAQVSPPTGVAAEWISNQARSSGSRKVPRSSSLARKPSLCTPTQRSRGSRPGSSVCRIDGYRTWWTRSGPSSSSAVEHPVAPAPVTGRQDPRPAFARGVVVGEVPLPPPSDEAGLEGQHDVGVGVGEWNQLTDVADGPSWRGVAARGLGVGEPHHQRHRRLPCRVEVGLDATEIDRRRSSPAGDRPRGSSTGTRRRCCDRRGPSPSPPDRGARARHRARAGSP